MSKLDLLRQLDKQNRIFVRKTLIIFCGKICMYDMKKYCEGELTLHHDPPFRELKNTPFFNSFIICRENHEYLGYLEREQPELYKRAMENIRYNKQLLLESNIDCGCFKK